MSSMCGPPTPAACHDRRVGVNAKLLNDGEHVVLSTRTHVKALFVPALVLIVVCGLAGYLSSLPSGSGAGVWLVIIWVVGAAILLAFCVTPFLRWLATTYTVTDRRLITRRGVLTRRGHDIPLNRISDVSYERGLLDRVLGCGTLIVSDASERGDVLLHDIPRVERAQLMLSEQLFRGTSIHDAPAYGSAGSFHGDGSDDGT